MNWKSELWNEEQAYANGLNEGRFFAGVKDKEVELMTQSVQMAWPDAPREAVMEACIQSRRQRLAAVPDLSVYPELEGCREAIQASDRGYMEGGGLTEGQMAVMREYLFLGRKHSASTGLLPDSGCTGIYIADSPEGPLAGNNLDDWPSHAPIPLPRGPLQTPKGLGLIAVSCGIFGDEETPEIFPVPIDHMVSHLCERVDDALELLTRFNYFWGPHNRLYWDKTGKSAVIEKSAIRYGIRHGDGYSYTTAIHMETPEMKPFLRACRDKYLETSGIGFDSLDQNYWLEAEKRHHNLAKLTAKAAKNPSFEAVRDVMQARHGSTPICLHGDKCYHDEPVTNYTIIQGVWQIAQNKVTCWRMKHEGDKPCCQHEPETVVFA